MQTKGGALLCTVLAGLLVAAATASKAEETCSAGPYTVSTSGPTVNGAQTQTSITYVIEGAPGPDHVAAVAASGSTSCAGKTIVDVSGSTSSAGNQWYNAGEGDPVTGLGKNSCHDEAAKINPNGTRVEFTITVSGARAPAPKTVVIKKGNTINRCEIVGIGDPAPPEVVAPVTEIISEPGSACSVEFTMDKISGKVLNAQLVTVGTPVPNNCQLHVTSVENLRLSLDGFTNCPSASQLPDGSCSLGSAKFGNGYAHTGSNSCTTRIIGGRVYSWGDPCPE